MTQGDFEAPAGMSFRSTANRKHGAVSVARAFTVGRHRRDSPHFHTNEMCIHRSEQLTYSRLLHWCQSTEMRQALSLITIVCGDELAWRASQQSPPNMYSIQSDDP